MSAAWWNETKWNDVTLWAEPLLLTYCFPHLFVPQYKQNPEMFKQTARLWSHFYAGAPVSSVEYTGKIDKLCAMGFERVSRTSAERSSAEFPGEVNDCFSCSLPQNAVIVALSSKSWDVETATELLLSNWILTSSCLFLPHTYTPSWTPCFEASLPVTSSVSQWTPPLRVSFPSVFLCSVGSLPPLSLLTAHPLCSTVPHSNQLLCELLSLVSWKSRTFHPPKACPPVSVSASPMQCIHF